ncbi:MAG: hypothetical protein WA144_05685, partial [Candidatus Methanoperedens sp.]
MGKYIEVQITNLMEEHKEELYNTFAAEKEQKQANPEPIIRQKPKEVQTIQKTLGGSLVSTIPKVRTTDGHLMDWDRDTIVKQLLKETK